MIKFLIMINPSPLQHCESVTQLLETWASSGKGMTWRSCINRRGLAQVLEQKHPYTPDNGSGESDLWYNLIAILIDVSAYVQSCQSRRQLNEYCGLGDMHSWAYTASESEYPLTSIRLCGFSILSVVTIGVERVRIGINRFIMKNSPWFEYNERINCSTEYSKLTICWQ